MSNNSMMNKIAFLIFACGILLASCGPNLRETGIPTRGTVLSKRDMGLMKNRKFYVTVGYFTQPDKENPVVEPKKDSPRTIDEIIEGIRVSKFSMGDYMTTEIMVDRSVHDALKEGDYVDLRYEKGNPEHAVIE